MCGRRRRSPRGFRLGRFLGSVDKVSEGGCVILQSSFHSRQGQMRSLWVVLTLGLIVSACSGQNESGSTEAQPPAAGRQVTTTVQLPGVNTQYDYVDQIRSTVEEGGFVCAAWAVRPDDEFTTESASCVGVLAFAIHDSPALIVEHLELQHSLMAIDSDVAYDLVGPNWSVTCQDRKDLCEALLTLLGGEIIVSDLAEE